MSVSLLPDNRSVLEDALGISTDPAPAILAQIEAVRGFRYARPLDITVAPWLVLEYGLGPIADFFDTIEDLIDQGRAWQRIRGTPEAFHTAMRWIGYPNAAIEDQGGHRRRRWHLYQCAMGELPGASEGPRLANAEYLGEISDPARSEFFRGHHGYDVRVMRWGGGRFGNTIWGDSSGVRLDGGSVKWSHGRFHSVVATDVISDWEPYGWDSALEAASSEFGTWSETLTWATPMLYWDGALSEVAVKTWLLLQQQAHIAFFDGDGEPIGYARVIRAPVDNSAATESISVIYTVRTGFGDGYGREAASIAVVFGLVSADGVPPFKAWLEPDEVAVGSGRIVGMTTFVHAFQQTVRETVELTLVVNPVEIVPMLFGTPAFRLG